ncbi:MAG: type I DNA topoisomerase [Planctomycetes bacterium]|nr:type I DNA topoisomerase [Planctomycetota bacterium]
MSRQPGNGSAKCKKATPSGSRGSRKRQQAAHRSPRSLVIVESPAKARTIHGYLGSSYVVKASMGHVRDLPKNRLGVDLEHGFRPDYLTIRGKGAVLQELRKALRRADRVYLAPDPDREGEAIAWHLAEALKIPPDRVHRVSFHEITRRAVTQAIANPTRLDLDKVHAQQARRILDRIVGYQLSPLLWEKIATGLSAGRVQSVAVRLIVEREREIRAFQPAEYWRIHVQAALPGEAAAPATAPLALEVKRVAGAPAAIPGEAAAQALVARIRSAPLEIASVATRERAEKPPAPFITSTLQQAASTRLRFRVNRTMRVAQQLYEGIALGRDGSVGLITYMRTDSYRVADEAIAAARRTVAATFGPAYVPVAPNHHAARKGAQEAHEAIRPTDPARPPQDLKEHLSTDQFKLYNLIYERFLASQMTPARYAVTEVAVDAGGVGLEARGRVVLFDGFTRVLSDRDEADTRLPPGLAPGLGLGCLAVEPAQHFTEPPARYTEASLVRALEKLGIGRPSTYASILSAIADRGYVQVEDRRFHATELGGIVTDQLVQHFPRILDPAFTSHMEVELDRIAAAEVDWTTVLAEFHAHFRDHLEAARHAMADLKNHPEPSEHVCEKCGRTLVVRLSRRGKFLACSGYPECRNTRSIDGAPKVAAEPTDLVCQRCGAPMVLRTGRRGRFLACSAFPRCRHTLDCDDQGRPRPPETVDPPCEKCGEPMIVRCGRRGRFAACSAYPACRNTRSLPAAPAPAPAAAEKISETCPECGADMVVKHGRRGPFAACSAYPKCRATRPLEAHPAARPD